MEICFYSLQHIGDVYVAASFIKMICNLNSDKNFYYYTILGDVFLKDIPNLKKITSLESVYRSDLMNGTPPESLLNDEIIQLIIKNSCEKTPYSVLHFRGKDYLFVNTWCAVLSAADFDYVDNHLAWNRMIEHINYKFTFNIRLKDIKPNDLVVNINNDEYLEFPRDISINISELNETVFIFNYNPRSCYFDMNKLNNYILSLAATYRVLVSNYCSFLDKNNANGNISFFDVKFRTKPDPMCINLVKLWKIAKLCKFIVMIPTGSSWTFLHEMDHLKENKLYIYGSESYYHKLNKNIEYLFGITNCIQNI
jgi:hypothetical protein